MVGRVYELSAMIDQLKIVRDRREAVEAEIEHLVARIASLKAELPDLQVTERTLTRLAGGNDANLITESSPPDSLTEDAPVGKLITPAKLTLALNGGGKPSGTPTVPDMITMLLIESRRRGLHGMEPRDLTRAISRRWWPGVRSEEISPTVWRMWKRGQLNKNGQLYSLAENTEAADLPFQEDSAAS